MPRYMEDGNIRATRQPGFSISQLPSNLPRPECWSMVDSQPRLCVDVPRVVGGEDADETRSQKFSYADDVN